MVGSTNALPFIWMAKEDVVCVCVCVCVYIPESLFCSAIINTML